MKKKSLPRVTLKGWADPKVVNVVLKKNADPEEKWVKVPGDPKLRSFERDGFITYAGTALVPPGTMVQLLNGEKYEVTEDKGHYADPKVRLRSIYAFSIRDVYAATVPIEAYDKREQLYPRKEQAYFGLCAKAEIIPLPLLDNKGKPVENIVKMDLKEQADAVEARLVILKETLAGYTSDPKKAKYVPAFRLLVESERCRLESLRVGTPAPTQRKLSEIHGMAPTKKAPTLAVVLDRANQVRQAPAPAPVPALVETASAPTPTAPPELDVELHVVAPLKQLAQVCKTPISLTLKMAIRSLTDAEDILLVTDEKTEAIVGAYEAQIEAARLIGALAIHLRNVSESEAQITQVVITKSTVTYTVSYGALKADQFFDNLTRLFQQYAA